LAVRSASRAGQIVLNTSTPSSPSSDGGANFFRHACQGCKTSAVMKIVVNEYADNEEYIKELAKFLQKSCSKIKTLKMTKTIADGNISVATAV
jgi:hypothetical protein